MILSAESAAPTPEPGSNLGEGEGDAAQVEAWLRDHATDIKLPKISVCPGHHSPWECFQAIRKRPSVALILGSRGSGKSFLSALDTHLTSREHPQAWDSNPGR